EWDGITERRQILSMLRQGERAALQHQHASCALRVDRKQMLCEHAAEAAAADHDDVKRGSSRRGTAQGLVEPVAHVSAHIVRAKICALRCRAGQRNLRSLANLGNCIFDGSAEAIRLRYRRSSAPSIRASIELR